MRNKFIHVFNSQDFKFIPKLVKAISEKTEIFDINEHFFVTHYQKVYNLIKYYPNVELTELQGAEIVNFYANDADWIFIHSFSKVTDALKIKRNIAGKVIWRSWGHDLFRNNEKDFSIKSILKSFREYLFSRKIEQFYAVAGANCIDEFNISLKSNFKRFYRLPYTYEEGLRELLCELDKQKKNKNSGLRIMIGHSGDQNNHHIEMIKRIQPYLKRDSKVVLVLAYLPGNEEYVRSVKKFAYEQIPNNIENIETFIPFKEYIRFLNDIDVAIFDSINSYALGNISILTSLGKTIYLNREGIINQAVSRMNFPHYCTDRLINAGYQKLSDRLSYNPKDYSDLCLIDEYEYLNRWKSIMNDLKSRGN
ncbi:TDP-N-acetylfucosamine:lipid II N-acetylfucosaminyltransferase [Robinsoniella peoriensis]|uniref:TDP-N-acetylfucosamine:lipid II N-acetylfucosaminyltransferase n=1 Tax=Robinsoniella peoriensis TaxID=180332 RepID=UPI003752A5F7